MSEPELLEPEFEVEWKSKFAVGSSGIGILFSGDPSDCDLQLVNGVWKVNGVEIPDEVVERRRCVYGLDLKLCCQVELKADDLVWIVCSTGEHGDISIPRSAIHKVVKPPPRR